MLKQKLNVFISHHHEEKRLAKAWQDLIRNLTQGVVQPWYSSDERAEGGIGPGEWRQEIKEKLQQAKTILVLVTPISNERSWLFFESGFASGQNKEVIPVYYFMKKDMLNGVFRSLTSYAGDEVGGANGIGTLCARLMGAHLGVEPSDSVRLSWRGWFDAHLDEVATEREHSFTRTLFQDHFHDTHTAAQLEGRWFAKWTQEHDSQPEEVFETDTLDVWTTGERLRLVGASAKQGLERLSKEAQMTARYYPMEGIVSRKGWVALSYWSAGRIEICGTTLLAPAGVSGELLEGTWQGFTARDIHHPAAFTKGRVLMARSEQALEDYWPHLKGA
jgi:hypothetical protein